MSATRTLWILRHAKAQEQAPKGGGDHARELKPRGRKVARAVGRFFAGRADAPEVALASDAARARETAELALEAGELECKLVLERAIYEAAGERLLALLQAAPKKAARVLLVGHQPGLGGLLGLLCGHEPDFPAGALARLEFVGDWSQLAPHGARLTLLVPPEVLLADEVD